MKTQETCHAVMCCQEHAKPTGGDITVTVKPWWSVRSLKKLLLVLVRSSILQNSCVQVDHA